MDKWDNLDLQGEKVGWDLLVCLDSKDPGEILADLSGDVLRTGLPSLILPLEEKAKEVSLEYLGCFHCLVGQGNVGQQEIKGARGPWDHQAIRDCLETLGQAAMVVSPT